jgi:hypothetical protein
MIRTTTILGVEKRWVLDAAQSWVNLDLNSQDYQDRQTGLGIVHGEYPQPGLCGISPSQLRTTLKYDTVSPEGGSPL